MVAAALGGCGFGAGRGTKDASIQVTSDFGTHVLGRAVETKVPGAETVMSLLQRHFKVSTRYGGGFVESIDGHSGGSSHLDWFYYVNGIEAPKGAATTNVHKGDHIWWDLHDWTATNSIPAVVGSYPEPFTNGIGGKEFPTLLDCAPGVQPACDRVGASLHKVGVKAGPQVLGTGSGSDSLAVVVGTWSADQGRDRSPADRRRAAEQRRLRAVRRLERAGARARQPTRRCGAHAPRERGPDRRHRRGRTRSADLVRHRHRRGGRDGRRAGIHRRRSSTTTSRSL